MEILLSSLCQRRPGQFAFNPDEKHLFSSLTVNLAKSIRLVGGIEFEKRRQINFSSFQGQ